jgi:hypothetical protein
MRPARELVWGGVLLMAMAAVAPAQSVELRIVERQGQGYMPWPPQPISYLYDSELNFAVQARVVGSGGAGVGIRSITFNIEAPCERDSWGTLITLATSNGDGTYTSNPNQGISSEVGRGGLASQFTFLAQSDPGANGLINASGPGHMNNVSSQDIGLVRAMAQGGPLLRAVDLDLDGIPDTSPLNGSGMVAPEGTTAALERGVGETYFGSDGNWVDVYRFRYTKMGFGTCPATTEFRVVPVGMPTLFAMVERVGGQWTARQIVATSVTEGRFTVLHCTEGHLCPADQDGSGHLDANDLFQFIADWFSGCTGAGGIWCSGRTADMDCNGVVTADDLFMFLEAWFTGC